MKNHKSLAVLGVGYLMLALPTTVFAESLKLVEVAAGGQTFFEERLPLDDGRALLSADDDGDGVVDAYSVSIAGQPPVRLNEPLSAPFTFAFPTNLSADGSTVVYGVDGDAGLRVYSVPVDGPDTASVRLDFDVAWDLDFNKTFISGDGQRLIFEGNQQSEDIYELFSVPIGGPAGTMIELNGPLLSSSVAGPIISPDGQTIIYRADQDAVEPNREIYAVAVDGSSDSVRLSGGGSLGNSPVVTSTDVVYWRNGAIYSVPITGPATASAEISVTLDFGDSIRTSLFQVTPDGRNVVYFVAGPAGDRLYSAPIGGPAVNNVQLTPGGQDIRDYKVASNSMVVYDAQRPMGGGDLYSVPIPGPSSAGVKLNQDVVPDTGGTRTFQVSPDGARGCFSSGP